MAYVKTILILTLVSSALADADPEDVTLMIAVRPVNAIDGRDFPCEDRFAATVLNSLRRNAVDQIKEQIDSKKVSQVDGLILFKTLNENLVYLDSEFFNITSQYHTECALCGQNLPCCLVLRAIWARYAVEAYNSTIDKLCSKASKFKLAAADCQNPLKQLDISNSIAALLRCEARCVYPAYTKEPICGSFYKLAA